MKFIGKVLMLTALSLFFSCETEDSVQEMATEAKVENQKVASRVASFDVYIKLVDWRTGQDVPASTLPGYGATNLATGETFFDSQYEPGLFESLPAGTYRFDARDGYFDGASSAVVEVSAANETSEGWVVATLRYWSE